LGKTKMVMISVMVPERWIDVLDDIAHQEGKSRSQLIRDLIFSRIREAIE